VSILVAASVRETSSMVNELLIRELTSNLDDNLMSLLTEASFQDDEEDT